MPVAATQAVRCVEGCTSSEPSTAAVLSVAIALIGLMGTLIALKIAFSSLDIARTQHESFMKELLARADFEVEVSFRDAKGDVIETDAAMVDLVISTAARNIGDKIATDVEFTLLVPSDLHQLAWGDKPKRNHPDVGPPLPMPNTDILAASDGSRYEAKYLTRSDNSQGREVLVHEYAAAKVETPREPGGERRVPIRCDVFCNEMSGVRSDHAEVVIRRKAT